MPGISWNRREARGAGLELVKESILRDVSKWVNRQQIMTGFEGFCKNSYFYSGKGQNMILKDHCGICENLL